MVASGQHTAVSLATRHDYLRARVYEVAGTVAQSPQLATAEEVMAPLKDKGWAERSGVLALPRDRQASRVAEVQSAKRVDDT